MRVTAGRMLPSPVYRMCEIDVAGTNNSPHISLRKLPLIEFSRFDVLHSAPLLSGAQLALTIENAAPLIAILVFGAMAALPRILVWLLQNLNN